MKEEAIVWVTLALSTAVHVPLLLNDSEPMKEVQPKPTFLELTPLPPPLPPPPPKAEEEPPPPEPKPPKVSPKKRKPVQETPSPEEPKVPEEPITESTPEVVPAELTGTTIVSDVGAGWAAPAGNGAGRIGAIGAGHSPKPKKRAEPPARSPIHDLPVVSLAELSRKPQPPPLQRILERHYPTRARNQGQSGEAKVRARIEANGDVRKVTLTSETGHGFGSACRSALLESRWSAPLDRRGKPVATWITYRCKFRIDD